MTNSDLQNRLEEAVEKIYPYEKCKDELTEQLRNGVIDLLRKSYVSGAEAGYKEAIEIAEWKDEQPILELGGWHTEEPTEDGWYLVDTPNFPKNCRCVVAEWDSHAKFYSGFMTIQLILTNGNLLKEITNDRQ